MANFPGNPYATDSHFLSNDAAAITKAITMLAFEVRTLNMLLSTQPVSATSKADAARITANLEEVAPRLGRTVTSTGPSRP